MSDVSSDDGRSEAAALGDTRTVCTLILVAAAAATLSNVFRAAPLQSANDRSRWCTVESLLSGEGFVIDAIDSDPGWSTIDKVRHEGHFYSTKPPLLPVLVAGVAWCVETVGGLDLRDDTRDVVPWVLAIVNVLPLFAGWYALSGLLERHARSPFTRLFVVGTAVFGTLLTPFTATLNNHVVAAWATMFAVVAAVRIVVENDRRVLSFAVCGLCAGFACTNELPAASMGVALFGLMLRADVRRTLTVFVPVALLPIVAYLALNVVVTGGLKPFYAYYGTEKYLFVHEGVPSYWMNPTGIDAGGDAWPVYLFHCTLGHHGIWSLSPVFLVAVAGWVHAVRSKRDGLGTFTLVGLGLTTIVLGFYLTRTANYNYGGHAAGLRWMLWLIPFWLVAIVEPLDRWVGRRGVRAVALVLLGLSTWSAWYSARTPWEQPWLFDLMSRRGWIDYTEPEPELERPLHSWFRSLPGTDATGQPRWIEFASTGPDGVSERLRMSDLGPEDRDGITVHRLRLRHTVGDAVTELEYIVDARAFAEGEPLGTSVLAVAFRTQRFAKPVNRLRGVPRPVAFRAERLQYSQVPLRSDAFECTVARGRVTIAEGDEPPRAHHCETWLNPQVPFGVVRWRATVSDPVTGEVFEQKVWQVLAASDFPATSRLGVDSAD